VRLKEFDLPVSDIRDSGLHQANLNMNMLIARKLLVATRETHEAPVVLDELCQYQLRWFDQLPSTRHQVTCRAGKPRELILSFGGGLFHR